MQKLHAFDRSVLAWTLVSIMSAGPLLADVHASQSAFFIPQGTQTITVLMSARAAVLPDRAWDCANGGSIILFDYGPDRWTLRLEDADTGAAVDTEGGQSQPETFTCPDQLPQTPQPTLNSSTADVSALTANRDVILFANVMIQDHSVNQHVGANNVPHFSCLSSGTPFSLQVSAEAAAKAQFFFDLDQGAATLEPNDAKMLAHKYEGGPDDVYFSRFQRTTPVPASNSAPQFDITGAVTGAPAGADRTIYFKLIDPPDTADYVKSAGDDHNGDNADAAAFILTLDGSASAGVGGVLETTWDAATKAHIILQGSDHAAGDNYQIEASFDKDFKCESTPDHPCAKSAVITVWKRFYVEDHTCSGAAPSSRVPSSPMPATSSSKIFRRSIPVITWYSSMPPAASATSSNPNRIPSRSCAPTAKWACRRTFISLIRRSSAITWSHWTPEIIRR